MAAAPQGSGLPLFRTATREGVDEGATGWSGSARCGRSWGGTGTRCGRSTRATRAGTRSPTGCCRGYWNGGAGCSVETLAELIGDTPKVAFDHYGREWGQHYQDPLWNAIGVRGALGKR